MELAHEKNGGPYTKDEQRKRRDEVYRLHYEYGYSARKIAEFLKVNRGTINRDIMYWHVSMINKWRHWDPATFVINQVERLELQRTRLRKQLDKVESFEEKMRIEKLILDIDMKITNFQIKLVGAVSYRNRKISDGINQWLEKAKINKRVFPAEEFLAASEKAREKIYKIYKEDMKF